MRLNGLLCGMVLMLVPVAEGAAAPVTRSIQSHGNPIIADGSSYSADPAPIVVGDTLFILAGRDEAPADVNDFIMPEWQMLATRDVASGAWTHYPGIIRPHDVFHWASPDKAYAGQIVRGRNGRFYLYAPVEEANSTNADRFAIGVAVSDNPLGPWVDTHPGGPIISQSVPVRNDIQNIDPTVLVEDDGKAYLYWGTFGQLRGMALASDMVTPAGPEIKITSLTGFFEAARILKRRGIYYLLYAGNEAGPQSPCTPTVYHACIAYGTAPSPLGPWTYRGVVLDPVSSTTSHEGAVEFKGQWYLVYHTADARGGGHFRRSVAIDKMQWDDSVSPARILKVQPTHAPGLPARAMRNLAPAAVPSASNEPVPVQYWIKALNDGIVRANPLPPDMWGSWMPHNPARQWIAYRWNSSVTINESRIMFWGDHPAGSGIGVAPPASWSIQYWDGSGWRPVSHPSAYPTGTDAFQDTRFDTVTTRCVRAVFEASHELDKYAGIAVQEWEVMAPVAMPTTAIPDTRKPPRCSGP